MAHERDHVERVKRIAKYLAEKEGAMLKLFSRLLNCMTLPEILKIMRLNLQKLLKKFSESRGLRRSS